MGAFYLNGEFSGENEARLVIKANTDDYPFRFKPKPEGNKVQFIELAFESKYASVHLRSVQPGIYRKKEDVQRVVNRLRREPKPIVLENSNLI